MNRFKRQHAEIEQAEKALIGSALIQPNRIDQLASKVQPQHFADPQLSKFWVTVVDFQQAGKPLDVVTLRDAAKRIWGDDGPATLAELFTCVPSAAHAEYYSEIVVNGFRLREFGRIASGIQNRVDDLAETPDSIDDWLKSQLDDAVGTSIDKARSVYDAGLAMLNSMGTDRAKATVNTGIYEIDRDVCGFTPGELVILAARPANCKTAFALQIADFAAHQGKQVLYLSLEMSAPELLSRLLCGRCGIDSRKLRRCSLSQEEKRSLFEANEQQKELPLFVQDPAKADLRQIQAMARIQAASTGIDMLVIDYIGLIDAGNSKAERREQVADWSRSLKRLSKELKIPILVLVQLNRETDRQTEPLLSNLAESASLEQDADIVMFLHRPKQKENALKLLVAKHRHADLSENELFLNVNSMNLQID